MDCIRSEPKSSIVGDINLVREINQKTNVFKIRNYCTDRVETLNRQNGTDEIRNFLLIYAIILLLVNILKEIF